ncbi:hypothetical protein [Flagellimonas flava]
MIYKRIVNGKIFTTNNNGVIEVLTETEFKEQKSWWKRAYALLTSL